MSTSVSATPITNIMLDGPLLADTRRGAVALEVSAPMETTGPAFYEGVHLDKPCILSTASPEYNGYARRMIGGERDGVHRWAYRLAFGPIPAGMTVEHLCRVRLCIEPSHLELLTPEENARRGQFQDYQIRCKHGHSDWTVLSTGVRKCRTCQKANLARYYRRHHVAKVRKLKDFCKHGHPLSGDNVNIRRSGTRQCRTCNRAASERFRERQAAP